MKMGYDSIGVGNGLCGLMVGQGAGEVKEPREAVVGGAG